MKEGFQEPRSTPGYLSREDLIEFYGTLGIDGLELANKTREKAASADRRARCATIQPSIDPDLRFIVERWDELPEPIKAGILAMVRAS